MPIHEYKCSKGHITEKLFLTFSDAESNKKNPVECTECGQQAIFLEFSIPRPAMFFGNPEGWHKPSPLKRYNHKVVSQIEGNKSAIG